MGDVDPMYDASYEVHDRHVVSYKDACRIRDEAVAVALASTRGDLMALLSDAHGRVDQAKAHASAVDNPFQGASLRDLERERGRYQGIAAAIEVIDVEAGPQPEEEAGVSLSTSHRVSGHALHHQGAPYGDDGLLTWPTSPAREGRGKCSCGVLSPRLPSWNARKRWHREHKAEVLAILAQEPDGTP